jgi:vacuolar-type H+-ATPase catalytic subunit A/Vma1
VIGTVQERGFTHKIMVPFDVQGEVTVSWIQEGSVTVNEAVAKIKLDSGTCLHNRRERPFSIVVQSREIYASR